MSGRRVLVTGAGGFICRHVVDSLLVAGWQVTALDRVFDPTLLAQWNDRVKVVEADASHLPNQTFTTVVHGAAITANPESVGQTPEGYVREHLDATLHLLDWAHEHEVERVFLMSSDAVFRETPAAAIDESYPTQPMGLYPVVKATIESLAQTLHAEYGRNVAALRLSYLYGPGEIARPSRPRISLVGRMIQEALQFGSITLDPTARARAWTYAPDIGRAVEQLAALPRLPHALYNLASDELVSQATIADAIQQLLPEHTIQIREEVSKLAPDGRQHVLSSQRLRNDSGFGNWTLFRSGLEYTLQWHQTQQAVTL
jgi:UDP-glucose 4-epimerase